MRLWVEFEIHFQFRNINVYTQQHLFHINSLKLLIICVYICLPNQICCELFLIGHIRRYPQTTASHHHNHHTTHDRLEIMFNHNFPRKHDAINPCTPKRIPRALMRLQHPSKISPWCAPCRSIARSPKGDHSQLLRTYYSERGARCVGTPLTDRTQPTAHTS